MREFRCAAILFDLDGVLVDSTPSVARQWRLWANERGVPEEDVLRIAHGRRTVEVVRSLAPHLDPELEAARLEQREADDLDGVEAINGARELLLSLPDGKWAVVTSGRRYLASSRLRRFGLPFPKVLVTADDVRNGKPHPEPYLKGAQMLGVAAEKALVIEDAPAGIQAAHAAGMPAIALPTTYSLERLAQADAVIRDLSRLQANWVDGTGEAYLQVVADTSR